MDQILFEDRQQIYIIQCKYRTNQLYLQQLITDFMSMRKRSGAFHCQTEEQFMELAQLSQQKPGIFYDDRANNLLKKKKQQKAMEIEKDETQPIIPKKMKIETPGAHSKIEKSLSFEGFQYSEVLQFEKQERKQLIRMEGVFKNIEISIISDNLEETRDQLATILRIQNSAHKKRSLELIIHKDTTKNVVLKFWIIDQDILRSGICQNIEEKPLSPIYQIYLRKCSKIITHSSILESWDTYLNFSDYCSNKKCEEKIDLQLIEMQIS